MRGLSRQKSGLKKRWPLDVREGEGSQLFWQIAAKTTTRMYFFCIINLYVYHEGKKPRRRIRATSSFYSNRTNI
jgi:hypothetical protein